VNGRAPRRSWYWRFMLVLTIALAIDFLVDDKLIFAAIAFVWVAACYFTLGKLKKSQQLRDE
jgi:uncharacterized membrane protein YhaH (DUF805 family)